MLSKGTLYIREVLLDASSANVLLPISKVTRASQDKAGLAPWLISAPFVVALEEEPVSLSPSALWVFHKGCSSNTETQTECTPKFDHLYAGTISHLRKT